MWIDIDNRHVYKLERKAGIERREAMNHKPVVHGEFFEASAIKDWSAHSSDQMLCSYRQLCASPEQGKRKMRETDS